MLMLMLMLTLQTGVNWQDIAASVGGRDAKSCQNKVSRV
jgi:hypothetical protein